MNRFLIITCLFAIAIISPRYCDAQQYKLRQSTSISGMNIESTIYVKGVRKRTETAGMMGMPAPPVTIEQCDLQRTIKLNDKKKLYYIEPFGKDDVIDEDVKPAVTTKTKPVVTNTKEGGTVHMWYNITDTGERKKMNGFTARRVWTTQKIKPSADACMMKDSMIIKTDGWYIDLPQFNCPIRYAPTTASMPQAPNQPECKDKFVTHRSGKGKLGFPLTEKRTIIMGNGKAQTSEFTTNLETLEFASLKLDSMLFEIPPGYKQAMNESELEEKMDMNAIMEQYKNQAQTSGGFNPALITDEKPEGVIRIGVFEPKNDGQLQSASLQQYMVGIMNSGKVQAVAVANEEEAIAKKCDYSLNTDITKIKSGSKVGGLLKAVKNADPNAASSFTIDASLVLTPLTGGSAPGPQNVSGKYDGKVDDAARRAMDEGSRLILKVLK